MKKVLSLFALLSLSACISGTQVGQQPRLSTANAPLAMNGDVTVASGDTVYGIARRHNVSMSDLIAANHLQAPYVLQAGQVIHLPATGSAMNGNATSAATPYDRGVTTAESLQPLAPVDSSASNASITSAPLDENGNALPEGTGKHDMVLTPLGPSTSQAPLEGPTGLTPANPSEGSIAAAAQQATAPAIPAKTGIFDWPVSGHVTSAGLNGMDIAAPKGTAVQAAAGGTVVKAGADGAGGNMVIIRHPEGYETTYSHLERVLVDADAVVGKGDAIGTVGTASTRTPLVHFGLSMNGTSVDPTAWLPAR